MTIRRVDFIVSLRWRHNNKIMKLTILNNAIRHTDDKTTDKSESLERARQMRS